ncbi:MAG: hypothetical protein HY600_00035 [Candidatus Omnitrophica bacterium]|nr:hypothetical protein [Candidatus Omnitrophota bacterium]
MRRFAAAILVFALLAPARAWALRPRAGRELSATTTLLTTGLEERASSPDAGLEEQPYTAAVARLVKTGLLHLDYLRKHCKVSHFDVDNPEQNVFRRGKRWGWHAHVATVKGDRLNIGLFYDLEERDGALVLDDPWAEPIRVNGKPLGGSEAVRLRGLIPEPIVTWLIKQGHRLIAQSDVQQALRHTMAYPPPDVMEMGDVATDGAKGLRVTITYPTLLHPGDSAWVAQPASLLARRFRKPLVLTIRRRSQDLHDEGPRDTATVPLAEEIQAILRSWGPWAYPPGMARPYKTVLVLPDVQLKSYPALLRFLQLYPPELRGTLAVITKKKRLLNALAGASGVMTGSSFSQLTADVTKEARAKRSSGTIVLYVPSSEVGRARPRRSSFWEVTTVPLVTPKTLPQFLSCLEHGGLTVRKYPPAQYLADRLEQWL